MYNSSAFDFYKNDIKLLITGNSPGVFKNCMNYPAFLPTVYCPFPGWIMEVSFFLKILTFLVLLDNSSIGHVYEYNNRANSSNC